MRSPYLRLALVLNVAMFPFWARNSWWETVIGVTPNLLGFTLGAFAILMGFGDDSFRAVFYRPQGGKTPDAPTEPSIAVDISASFVQFAVFQMAALIVALLAKTWSFHTPLADPIRSWLPLLNGLCGFFGFWLFLYSLCLLVAATHSVFAVAQMYQAQVAERLRKEALEANKSKPCVEQSAAPPSE